MMHKAWRSIEEVPYCFSRSSIKFHGHTGGKIDDLNPNWDYLAGRSYQIPQICLVGLFPPLPLPQFCQHFSTFQEYPEANFFKPHMVNLWVWEKFLAPVSVTLGQGR